MITNEYLEENGLEHMSEHITYDYILDKIMNIMKLKTIGGRNLYEFHPMKELYWGEAIATKN